VLPALSASRLPGFFAAGVRGSRPSRS
jgi:hypothetical protein